MTGRMTDRMSRNGDDQYVRVRGVKGFLEGEERLLKRGDEVVVGRSRKADLSVRMSTKYLERMDRGDVSRSEAWRTVSRQHARITFYRDDLIVIEDLSANGRFVDGERVDGKLNVEDLADNPRVITLGAVERLRIEIV